VPGVIPSDIRSAYLDSLCEPAAVRAICQGYRAGALVDPGHDVTDRTNQRRLTMPTLVLWPDEGERVLPFDPAVMWAAWASDLRTKALRADTSCQRSNLIKWWPRCVSC
jgi:haloacetate dehalogenase